jgi:hypothetical protein
MDIIYMLTDPYHDSFDELIDFCRFDLSTHCTAGLFFIQKNGCLILAHMSPSTPGTKIPQWRTQLQGLWLIKIGDKVVHTISKCTCGFHDTQGYYPIGDAGVDPLMLGYRQTVADQALINANTTRNVVQEPTRLP